MPTSFKILDGLDTLVEVGTLSEFDEARLSEGLNREYLFRAYVPCTENNDWQQIELGHVLEIAGTYFDVTKRTRTRESNGVLLVRIEAEHISYRLIADEVVEWNHTGTALEALTNILGGTDLEVGDVAGTTSKTLAAKNMTKREILIQIANVYELDLAYGERGEHGHKAVHMLDPRGKTSGNGPSIEAAVNAVTVEHDDDSRNEAGHTVSGYVEVAELSELDGYGTDYEFELGDYARLIDTELSVDAWLRIVFYQYDPQYPMRSSFELANFRRASTDIEAKSEKELDRSLDAINDELEEDYQTLHEALREVSSLAKTGGDADLEPIVDDYNTSVGSTFDTLDEILIDHEDQISTVEAGELGIKGDKVLYAGAICRAYHNTGTYEEPVWVLRAIGEEQEGDSLFATWDEPRILE